MACSITKGRTSLPCKDDFGGIKNVYIMKGSDWVDNLFMYDTNYYGLGNVIYDWNYNYTVYKFALRNSANTFTQEMTSSRDTGTTIYTQTLNVVLPKLSVELEYQIKLLCNSNPRVFIETNKGHLLLIGNYYGCEVSGKSEVLGTLDAMTGYTLSIVGVEKQPVWYLMEDAYGNFFSCISPASVG